MREEDLKALLKRYGWSMYSAKLYWGKYYYTKRREAGKQLTKYMGTEKTIERLTEQDVLRKLGVKEGV